MALGLRPVKLTEARAFVSQHHSHNGPPVGWLFGVGVESAGNLCGVVIAGRPVSLKLQQADPRLVEITRCCTDQTRMACSMLYGAICRAAAALGYCRAITYTLESEDATALKATGWTCEGVMAYRDGWDSPTRPRAAADLFGNRVQPDEPKVRWSKALRAAPKPVLPHGAEAVSPETMGDFMRQQDAVRSRRLARVAR